MELSQDDLELLCCWYLGLEDSDMEDDELYSRIKEARCDSSQESS